ncbi:MAG: hypothetical protein E4H03_09885 [Myxococcales bacterium]|nr:MAG: hypothetical protein E4H03_09885 [Myxococcales bacterium]
MYVPAPKLGIGTGIGTQAMADIAEYSATTRRRRKALGACCDGCGDKGAWARHGLGATASTFTAQPPVSSSSSGSPIGKLLLLAGLGVGGFFLVKRLRAGKK